MSDPYAQLLPWMARLADALPLGTMSTLAHVVAAGSAHQWEQIRLQITRVVPQPHLRALVLEMVSSWQQQSPNVEPAEIALMLRTAATVARSVKESQSVELVWTGPLVTGPAMRRTDQALLQVINAAQQSLLIVSFAVYKIPAIATAMVRAAERGVHIRICIEAPEPSAQRMAHDTIRALGSDVAQRAAIYVWPSDKRPVDGSGRTGVLHVKCAAADSRLLFISSANLTDNAMLLNMELGVLIHSSDQAIRVEHHFARLIAEGVLQHIQTPRS